MLMRVQFYSRTHLYNTRIGRKSYGLLSDTIFFLFFFFFISCPQIDARTHDTKSNRYYVTGKPETIDRSLAYILVSSDIDEGGIRLKVSPSRTHTTVLQWKWD